MKKSSDGRTRAAGVAPAAARRALPGEVRIIGGRWKRTRLPVPDLPGLRPTPDRVRETLFNWLGQDLQGWRCVDVFAGTGALGLEAASRGAAEVHLFERDPQLVARLAEVAARLAGPAAAGGVRVVRGDGLSLLPRLPTASMDLVLLDPPFDAGLHAPALAAALPVLAPGARIYLEDGVAWDATRLAPLGLQLHRHMQAGAVHAHLLQRTDPTA